MFLFHKMILLFKHLFLLVLHLLFHLFDPLFSLLVPFVFFEPSVSTPTFWQFEFFMICIMGFWVATTTFRGGMTFLWYYSTALSYTTPRNSKDVLWKSSNTNLIIHLLHHYVIHAFSWVYLYWYSLPIGVS